MLPTVFSLLHGTCERGSNPVSSSAAVDTMVNTWPGSYRPASGLTAGIRPAWCAATARIRPVPACTATMAAERGSRASAESAAIWARLSSVVLTGLPSLPVQRLSTLTWPPDAFWSTTSMVGEPVRVRW